MASSGHMGDPLHDRLTDVDEVLENQVVPTQQSMLDELRSIREAVGGGPTPGEAGLAIQIDFSNEVATNTTTDNPVSITREVPFDGRITTFFTGWPDGTQNGAGIALLRNEGERLFPRNPEDQFVAFNDVAHPFDLRAPVSKGETLEAQFTNADPNQSHFLNAVVTIEEMV